MKKPKIVRLVYEKYLATVIYSQDGNYKVSDMRGSFLKPFYIFPNNYYKVLCAGYSRSLLYLLQRLGFQAVNIDGTTIYGLHAWNKVEINGEWYNLDSTWDDYGSAAVPNSNKDNFLKSDTEFSFIHDGPQKEPNGAPSGYLKYGVRIPASATNSLTAEDYN